LSEYTKQQFHYFKLTLLSFREIRLDVIKTNHKFYFDRFKDVDKITLMGFKEFAFKFIKNLRMKILIQGNFSKTQAIEITENILKNTKESNAIVSTSKTKTSHEIPQGFSYLRVKSLLPNDKNSIIKNYYQVGVATVETECLLELLVKIMREPLFNYIRTREQLGYSVACTTKKDDNIMLGLTISVETQEKRNPSKIVDQKIENFLKDFLTTLKELDDEDFETIKCSSISQKQAIDTDLECEVIRNWSEIRESKYQFERNHIEARQLELIRKEDLIAFFCHHLLPENVKKLSLQIVANADDGYNSLLQHGFLHLDLITDDEQNTIKNIAQFKKSLAACLRF
jgi:nardilysin